MIVLPKTNKLYLSKRRYNVCKGGAGCFAGNQLVQTIDGNKPIKDIVIGDKVLCRNIENNKDEYKPVLKTFKFDNNTKINVSKHKEYTTISNENLLVLQQQVDKFNEITNQAFNISINNKL